jgi:hypothetical protein
LHEIYLMAEYIKLYLRFGCWVLHGPWANTRGL